VVAIVKMARTVFIDTNKLPRAKMNGGGEMTEIVNDALAGAKNVVGALRWLGPGERFSAAPCERHQLLYLVEGRGTIILEGKEHDVEQGMGLYLGPLESAALQAAPGATLKIFHLVVPQIPK
jgi:mannose-6-phosphate isomerase-like protein (cupin superfamily)